MLQAYTGFANILCDYEESNTKFCGAVIDLGAWYPWESLEGQPMSDSCGILFVDLPGVYTVNKTRLFSTTGIRQASWPAVNQWMKSKTTGTTMQTNQCMIGEPVSAVVETGEASDEGEDNLPEQFRGGFDRIKENGGPGMPLGAYIPKGEGLAAKFSSSLTPFDCFGPSCGVAREQRQ